MVYRTIRIVKMPIAPILKAFPVWNNFLSISIPFGSFLSVSNKLIDTITIPSIINTTAQRFMNGNPGVSSLKPSERGIASIAAQSTELGVALFQNKPNIKIANMAGVVKPVYS